MPIDKDFYRINEAYFPKPKSPLPNKTNHNTPSTLGDVKKSTPATSGSELDIKGQLSDKGFAGNTPVDVQGYEEDSEAPSHEELIGMLTNALDGLKKHIKKAKHEQPKQGNE
jgi:hypothetical protein